MEKRTPKTKEEARQYAVDWQVWVGEQNKAGEEPTLYQSDLAEWQEHFYAIGIKFQLLEEFKENGIY